MRAVHLLSLLKKGGFGVGGRGWVMLLSLYACVVSRLLAHLSDLVLH